MVELIDLALTPHNVGISYIDVFNIISTYKKHVLHIK